jgi:xanthine dehydrogenase YagS FAD-binding subunit
VKSFAYVNPRNEREAVSALGATRGRILPLAGGMDLIAMMKDYIAQPERVINVKGLDGTIASSASGLQIGAAVKLVDLAEHAAVRRDYPAIADAAGEVGTPQIRNVGTVGGNLAQRPRCWYFRNEEFHCLKKGGSHCFAVEGENQFHAVLGGGPCFIVHPSSLAVPLLALGAKVRILSPAGSRELDIARFFVLPADNINQENVLAPNELITHVLVPPARGMKNATYEVRFKQSHDWPLAMATAALDVVAGKVRTARIVLGAVAPVPWRSEAAEAALTGKTISEQTATEAAEAALKDAEPMTENAYKVQIARTAVKRAILKASGAQVPPGA